jgi:predicted DNA-binding transcriptional regulator AlpA
MVNSKRKRKVRKYLGRPHPELPVNYEPGGSSIVDKPKRRLIPKREVLARVGVTYPTLWKWMRNGKFPRSRAVGFRAMWFEHEVEAWLKGLPNTPLKGDKAEAHA